MFRKSLKYLAVVFINFMILWLLLLAWLDDFEFEFNKDAYFFETLKLIGLSVLFLLLLRILIFLFRYFKINSKKIFLSSCLVIVLSSSFYVDYSKRIYNNRFINKELRAQVIQKVKPYQGSWFGNIAENLTEKEYHEITKIKWFPTIPKNAENINYNYEYDCFLPDYSFSLSYDLPINAKVDTMHFELDTFSKRRTFTVVNNKKRVTYSESLW